MSKSKATVNVRSRNADTSSDSDAASSASKSGGVAQTKIRASGSGSSSDSDSSTLPNQLRRPEEAVTTSTRVSRHSRGNSADSSDDDFPTNHDDDDEEDNHGAGRGLETKRMNGMMLLLTFLTSVCGFLFGYDTGYISGALVVIGDDLGAVLSNGDKELVTSATSLGALVAACLGGVLADHFGRKWIISFANVLFIAGAAMQTAAHGLWTMIGGRFVMGWGVGLASLLAPLYISEMAPSRFRGRLVVINVLAITGGQLLAYAISVGLAHVDNGWRILVGLSMIPAAAQMVVFVFMPDTPRYLVSRGRVDAARRVLQRVYSGSDPQEIEDQLEELVKYNLGSDSYVDGRGVFDGAQQDSPDQVVARATDGAPGKRGARRGRLRRWAVRTLRPYYEIVAVPSHLRAVVITCGLQGIQQFSGFNSLMYFSATIFESVGFENPTSVALIVAGTNFVFTVVAFLTIDRVGRRRILLCTVWGMALGLVINAIAFHFLVFTVSDSGGLVGDPANRDSPWSAVVIFAMLLYVAFYAAGIGNVPWQQGEMFPTRVRGAGTSLATATNWAGSLVVSATFLTMLERITPTGTFALFAGLCATGQVFVFLLYPETAGLTLEEVQTLLARGFSVRESVEMNKARRLEIARRDREDS